MAPRAAREQEAAGTSPRRLAAIKLPTLPETDFDRQRHAVVPSAWTRTRKPRSTLEGWPFRSSATVTIALSVIGMVFFGVLLGYDVRQNKGEYVPGLALIVVACVSELLRGLFGSDLSPHPATAGVVWILMNASLIVLGFVKYYRRWSRVRQAAGAKRRTL